MQILTERERRSDVCDVTYLKEIKGLSPRRPDRFWGPPSLLQEYVDLYIHSPIHLHGVVLN
jgi:hypothetical protein